MPSSNCLTTMRGFRLRAPLAYTIFRTFIFACAAFSLLMLSAHSPVQATINQTINFQTKIVLKTTGLNLSTGSPACVKSGADTCDFQIRVWNHQTNTSTTSGTGNLMFTQTFQDVEIGATGGIFNLSINSCGSAQSGNSEWGTSTGTCTVVDDSDADSDPGVDFDRNDLWIELGFASADTSGSLGSFTELFARTTVKSVPSAFHAQSAGSVGGFTASQFVQLGPSAVQTANVSTALIWLNETNAASPNLLQLQVGATDRLILNNAGQLQLPTQGSTGGLLVGGDVNLYRSAANTWQTDDRFTINQTGTTGTVYGLHSSATGVSTTNIAGYFTASGATNNYGLIVAAGQVGINNASPAAGIELDVTGDIRASATIGIGSGSNNVLGVSAAGGGPANSLFWGNQTVCTSGNTSCTTDPNNFNWNAQQNADPSVQGSLRFTTTHTGAGNESTYLRFTNTSLGYTLVSGDYLEYDVYCDYNNPSGVCDGSVDLNFTDATNLRAVTSTDQNAINNNTGSIASYARGRWYHRKVAMPAGVLSKIVNYCALAEESDTDGTYTNYYRRIFITNGTSIKLTCWDGGEPAANTVASGSGNTNSGALGSWYDDLYVSGNLTVNGTTTYNQTVINQVNLEVMGDLVLSGSTAATTSITSIKASYLYEALNDSDGGQWRNSTQSAGLSWYTETPDNGAGDPCVLTDDRCGNPEFPSVANIVANNSSLYIFEAKGNTLWMRFDIGTNKGIDGTVTGIKALDGEIYISTNTSGNSGLYILDFKGDRIRYSDTTDRSDSNQNIAGRNGTNTFNTNNDRLFAIDNILVNDVDVKKFNNGHTYVALATDSAVNVLDEDATGTYSAELAGGTATASSTTNGAATNAFDNNGATAWGAATATNQQLQYDFTSNFPKRVSRYGIWFGGSTTFNPNSWTFEGSNNCSTWTTLDTQTGQGGTSVQKYYNITSPQLFSCYRLNVSSNNGGTYIIVYELDLFESATMRRYYDVNQLDDVNNVRLTGVSNSVVYTNETDADLEIHSNISADTADQAAPDFNVDTSVADPISANPTSTQYGLEIREEDSSVKSSIFYGSASGLDRLEYTGTVVTKTDVYNTDVVGNFVGFWPMSENTGTTTADKSGNAYTLTFNSTPVWATGINGAAVDFDADTDYLSAAADNADFTLDPAIGYSMGAWINPDNIADDFKYFMGNYNTQGFIFGLWNNSTNELGFFDGTAWRMSGYAIAEDGAWKHVGVTNDNGSCRFYVNGVLVATVACSTSTVDGNGAFHVGGGGTGAAAQRFDGKIDEVFLTKSYPLSDSDMMALYQRSRTANLTATTFTSTTIGASGATWIPNQFQGQVVEITSGTGSAQTRTIVSNTATVLTVTPAFSVTPSGTSVFRVLQNQLPGVNNVKAVNWNTRGELFIGTNDTSDGGGVIRLGPSGPSLQKVKDYHHGNAGKTDGGGTAWGTTTDYDDSIGISILGLDSQIYMQTALIWYDTKDVSIRDQLSQIQDLQSNAVQAVDGAGTPIANQVIRFGTYTLAQVSNSGTGFIVCTQTKNTSFGITFDSPPTVIVTAAQLADVSTAAYSIRQYVSMTNTTSFSYLREVWSTNTTASCIMYAVNVQWIAIGTYSAISSTGADLAENYLTRDLTIEAGDVIGIDPNYDISVRKTQSAYDSSAIGIVATQPSITIGPKDGTTPGVETSITGNEVKTGEGKSVPVALAGRVPVKVTLENGPIKRGDFLTPASKPGYAMKATKAGITIGRAMENFDGSQTIVNTDKQLAELDKLIESGDINVPTVQQQQAEITQFEDQKDNNSVSLQTEYTISDGAKSFVGSLINSTEGKVMTFVQPGYFWGELSQSAVVAPLNTDLDVTIPQPQEPKLQATLNADGSLATGTIAINDQLTTGIEIAKAYPSETSVLGSFNLGSLIIRESDSSLNAVKDALRLQTLSSTPIEFFNAKFIFDKDGNLVAKGKISVQKLEITGNMLGNAAIEQGFSETKIELPGLEATDSIFITFTSAAKEPLFIKQINPELGYFIVSLPQGGVAEETINFNYLVVGRSTK